MTPVITAQSHLIAPLQDGAAPAPDSEQVLRPRIEAAIHRTRGSVQEALLSSGFLDSIGAMELVAAIQHDLGAALADLQMSDLATVTTLVAAVAAAVRSQAAAATRAAAP
jgi:phosphopantetheine binding protein